MGLPRQEYWNGTILKVFIEFVTILLLLHTHTQTHTHTHTHTYIEIDQKACGILATQPGMEPTPLALEGKFLTTGLPGKSLF